jgi:presenilin-like A22 family membrane protease
MSKKTKPTLMYFTRSVSIVLGLVLMWRGTWYVLDEVDVWLFQGSHMWTALMGIFVGILVLYLPDGDLKEIEKL